jgi:DNA-binding beta-propeller fold protein YncE
LAYDSDMDEIFVTHGGNTVSIISDKTNTVVATAPLNISGGVALWEIDYDSGKRELFAANTILDVLTGQGFLINNVLILSDSDKPEQTSPSTSDQEQQAEPFPTTIIITVSGVSLAVLAAGLLVYFKKRKHQTIPTSTTHSMEIGKSQYWHFSQCLFDK